MQIAHGLNNKIEKSSDTKQQRIFTENRVDFSQEIYVTTSLTHYNVYEIRHKHFVTYLTELFTSNGIARDIVISV